MNDLIRASLSSLFDSANSAVGIKLCPDFTCDWSFNLLDWLCLVFWLAENWDV